jgi:hypothetical protein
VGAKKKERKREDAGNRVDRGEVVPGTHEFVSLQRAKLNGAEVGTIVFRGFISRFYFHASTP